MFAVFFYIASSLLLSVMIINANGPVIDYSYLSKPTATSPPTPMPIVGAALAGAMDFVPPMPSTAEDWSSMLMDDLASSKRTVQQLHINSKRSSLSRLSSWSWHLVSSAAKLPGAGRRNSRRSSNWMTTLTKEEQRPRKSTYSPPASYSYSSQDDEDDQHSASFNKSGLCHTGSLASQEQKRRHERDHKNIRNHVTHRVPGPKEDVYLDDWRAHPQVNLPIHKP
ncbi:hypothetical protein BGZ99_008420 [Dissophora globulifera]|uniref:Uncharacterized protein n=1 Tax=Dissophora globulifera TaxID=979702 RepID=A0A9P6RVD2_9FUNG|nr:hypothetical protein BGZ99_008420 [Dissophora globulifera]